MSAIALLTDHHQYFLYTGSADMRKSIDGLCGIVYNELGRAVNYKDVFIFLNKRGTHIKLLLQEADGFTLLYRRRHTYQTVASRGRWIYAAIPPVTQRSVYDASSC
jgi:transposase